MNPRIIHAPTTFAGHYVYAYRDEKGKIRYVGYGKGVARATSRNRSKAMLEFLLQRKYTLEVAGQYGSKETGLAVETALISLLHPDLNSRKAPGPTHLQFRPLGVPEKFSNRLAASPLESADFTGLGQGRSCPFLFVFISKLDFVGDDSRRGYSLAKPLSDPEILKRMEGWWQLGRYVRTWKTHPQQSPRILVGVTGDPAHRIIIGAVAINWQAWGKHPPDRGLYLVPTLKTANLDAHGLRGRLISPNANIKFGAFKHQFFVILGRNGKAVAGQR